MVRNREEAAKAAENTFINVVGMCQQVTRGWLLGDAAGDRDFDGDADAVDGWKSEPEWAKHHLDKNPPRGVPVAWSGGSDGHGHRALSLGNGMIRSTDVPTKGNVGTVHISWFAKNWSSLKYLGWSETITGERIPLPPKPKPTSRGKRVDQALEILEGATGKGKRRDLIRGAIRKLSKIKKFR